MLPTTPATTRSGARGTLDACPFALSVETIAAFTNVELVDHPVYSGLELQVFDDPQHGAGALVLLGRRADRRTDVYIQPGLRVDRDVLSIGAGPGQWVETTFDAARLDVHPDGVEVELAFTDRHGDRIEIGLDDRDGRARRRGPLLAPVGATIEDPRALLLVAIGELDLVHRTGRQPHIGIGEHPATIGTLPLQALHRRRLIKYGRDLVVVRLNPAHDGLLAEVAGDGAEVHRDAAGGITAIAAADGQHRAWLHLDPALPRTAAIDAAAGRWAIGIDGAPPLTGGTWTAHRREDRVELTMAVTRRWRPRALPPLMRAVTTLIPTFRRWPTSYRWRGTLVVGDAPALTSRWWRTRTGPTAYGRVTQGRGGSSRR